MIKWVYDNCLAAQENNSINFHVSVVTDDYRIEKEVQDFNGEVLRIDDPVNSGTDRIALAYTRYFKGQDWDLVINMQGDEPLLSGEELARLAQAHLASSFPIYTLVHEREVDSNFHDLGHVKVVFCEQNNKCLYFSRNPIPFGTKKWYQHIGVYSYHPQTLLRFAQIPPSLYEKLERLEQLRALEEGMAIGALKVTQALLGVDDPGDISKVEALLDGKKK